MCSEFYYNGVKDGKFGGFVVQGYVDNRPLGWVHLRDKEGNLKLALSADATRQWYEGPLQKSVRAKEIIGQVCKILEEDLAKKLANKAP